MIGPGRGAGGLSISPLAGKPAPAELLIDPPAVVAAFAAVAPDPDEPTQRVRFGTSGHRGSALSASFNDWHVAAIAQAVCAYRRQQGVDGPLFLGMDTHALSEPAFATTLEVLAANGVDVMIAADSRYTPTPAVSRAIVAHNRERERGFADGIVVTPSHNPPDSGGMKYNPPSGGPAHASATEWIERNANRLLKGRLVGVHRLPFERALRAPTTHRYPYLRGYVEALVTALDLRAIAASGVRIGVDPLGGAGIDYWAAIAERYGLDMTVVNAAVDPTFDFMTVDWDGQIRMDPSSPYAMQHVIGLRDHFDVVLACDTDHDRHGIVTRGAGLMPANHYLAVAASYLCRHRSQWPASAAVAKTVVTSRMLDAVASEHARGLYEVPVGFKWFVDGLLAGTLVFAGEESAGASFACLDGNPWTTDKDGIATALLAAEIMARTGRDPAEHYRALVSARGAPAYRRIDTAATTQQKRELAALKPQAIVAREIAGEPIEVVLDRAPGNGEAIGGLKIITAHAWVVVRPSGTENLYKLYAESFLGDDHLERLVVEAQSLVNDAVAAPRRKRDDQQ